MTTPPRLYGSDLYTWVTLDGDKATIGFTPYACDRMEEMVAVEFKQPGEDVAQADPCGTVDVMKALIDIPAPVSGTILEINPRAVEAADEIREDPYGEFWLLKLRVTAPAEIEALVSPEDYEARTAGK